jgi:hypothetical protein
MRYQVWIDGTYWGPTNGDGIKAFRKQGYRVVLSGMAGSTATRAEVSR